jgi:hypothetical protein
MAVTPYIADFASSLSSRKEVCFGLHITLCAEWDRVKWSPLLPCRSGSRGTHPLCGEDGFFFPNPERLAAASPPMEAIMAEVNAQLDFLTKLGFDIRYADSHMFPEECIEGLGGTLKEWTARKGLLWHMDYYPSEQPRCLSLPKEGGEIGDMFARLEKGGRYVLITHPAVYGEEMLLTGNSSVSGGEVAARRAAELNILCGREFSDALERYSVRLVRYDEI